MPARSWISRRRSASPLRTASPRSSSTRPNAVGATQLAHKAVLDGLENSSPGTKLAFVGEFVSRGSQAFQPRERADADRSCAGCGMPSWGELCGFCSLRAQVDRKTAARDAIAESPDATCGPRP